MAALVLTSGGAFQRNRPPYPDPDRLVSVIKVAPSGEAPILSADFLSLRRESGTLGAIAAYAFKGLILTEGNPERIYSAQVTADFFSTLGIAPALGRALLSEEHQSERNHVVVISHKLWLRRFGADPNMIGKVISLDKERYTVVGVMPADFQLPKECDVWTPLALDEGRLLPAGTSPGLEVIARLKPGVTLDQAQAEVSEIARKLEGDHPENNTGRDIKLSALRESRGQELKVLEIKNDRPANNSVDTGKEK
jgi:putative ABC transport system permease protein